MNGALLGGHNQHPAQGLAPPCASSIFASLRPMPCPDFQFYGQDMRAPTLRVVQPSWPSAPAGFGFQPPQCSVLVHPSWAPPTMTGPDPSYIEREGDERSTTEPPEATISAICDRAMPSDARTDDYQPVDRIEKRRKEIEAIREALDQESAKLEKQVEQKAALEKKRSLWKEEEEAAGKRRQDEEQERTDAEARVACALQKLDQVQCITVNTKAPRVHDVNGNSLREQARKRKQQPMRGGIMKQRLACGYCGAEKMSRSVGADGMVRARCVCGGFRGDGVPRMHANWHAIGGEVTDETSNTELEENITEAHSKKRKVVANSAEADAAHTLASAFSLTFPPAHAVSKLPLEPEEYPKLTSHKVKLRCQDEVWTCNPSV